MITINQILDMFEVLESVGLRPPDIYARPASRGIPSGRAFAASVYAAAFNHGGYLWPEIERATLEYALEPQAEHYPKPWPTPGHIAARTAVARLAATLGTDADADRAWTDLGTRAATLLTRGTPPAEVFRLPTALDPDPHRHAAMWAGLVVVGGWDGWRMSDLTDRSIPARFRAAYIAARQRQRLDPAAVRGILTVASQTLIEGPNAK